MTKDEFVARAFAARAAAITVKDIESWNAALEQAILLLDGYWFGCGDECLKYASQDIQNMKRGVPAQEES